MEQEIELKITSEEFDYITNSLDLYISNFEGEDEEAMKALSVANTFFDRIRTSDSKTLISYVKSERAVLLEALDNYREDGLDPSDFDSEEDFDLAYQHIGALYDKVVEM